MDIIEIEGDWNELKAKLKEKFAVLTEDDLMFKAGEKEEMYAKIQIKIGKSKEEMAHFIRSISSNPL